jgi:hypothetical protein
VQHNKNTAKALPIDQYGDLATSKLHCFLKIKSPIDIETATYHQFREQVSPDPTLEKLEVNTSQVHNTKHSKQHDRLD